MLFIVDINARTCHHIFQITPGKFTVMLKFFNAIINIAVHFVSITTINKSFYSFNDFLHMLRNTRIYMCTTHIELIHYLKISIYITSADITP